MPHRRPLRRMGLPNMRLKLWGLLLRESAVTSSGVPPRGGRSLAPAGTPPAA
jgi:hypothetical protein